MKRKRSVVLTVLVLLLFAIPLAAQESVPIEDRGYADPGALISAEELSRIMDRDDVKVVDFRGLAAFVSGHIPGAVHIDRSELADASAPYPAIRASAAQTAEVLGSKGIRPSDTVVVYDDNGLWAARIWWLLDMYGHEDVRLLDGGLDRWKALGYDTRIIGSRTNAVTYQFPSAGRETMSTIEDVLAAIDNDTIILDVRSRGEFTGETVRQGSGQGGRVPTAVWVEWNEALNEDGTFKTAAELRRIYRAVGITGDAPVITYCQGGVRCAHSVFVLDALLGYDDISNYDGSWVEWSNEPGLPVVRGE